MLELYQNIVNSLLTQPEFRSLRANEHELFKEHFATTAFTCRLTSCPHATVGFETERLLSEHKMSHVQCFECKYPGCQYPVLGSAQALKKHERKYHENLFLARQSERLR